jgi:beta-lactamase regulating signal transducer with metallopeptidase domain
MSDLETLRALLFAGELLLATSLVLGGAWIAASRSSASARHLAWLAAFAVLLILPLLAAAAPSFVQILLPPPPPQIPLTDLANDTSVAAMPAEAGGLQIDAATVALAAAALWLAGFLLIALRGAIAALGLRRLRRASAAYNLDPTILPGVSAGRGCELRISTAAGGCGPVTWGWFRPVILLPKAAAFWPRERLRAVLLHEFAHVQRRDSLAQLLSRIVCALYWPNPLVWMGARRLRREAEIAADDAVLNSGVRPSVYAGELLQLAAEFRGPAFSNVPLSMAAPSALEARVKSVLAPTKIRSGVTSMDVLKIAGLGIVATAMFVLARPSLAQDAPPAPAMEAAMATPPAPPVPPAPDAPPAPPAPPTDMAPPPPPPAAALPPVPPSAQVNADQDDEGADADNDNDQDVDNDQDSDNAQDNDNDQDNDEVTIIHSKNGHVVEKRTLRARDIKKLHAIVAQARREAHAALERARPEIRRAMSEAQMNRKAMDALKDARPQIDAAIAKVAPEIDKALAQARAELARADVDSKIKVRVDEALKRAEIHIKLRQERMKAMHGAATDRVMQTDRHDESDGPGSPEEN